MTFDPKSEEGKPDTIPLERWEHFLSSLRDRISFPSEKQPVTRCWKRTNLIEAINEVVADNKESLLTTFPPGNRIIGHLERLGWIRPMKVETPKNPSKAVFYLVDMEATSTDQPTPYELLQAWHPDGIICYMSAIILHSLTSQITSHNHICRLSPPVGMRKVSPQRLLILKNRGPRNPLGTEIFSFQGVPYYATRRSKGRLVGIQTRIEGPRTHLRVTTLEQTLIDTFFQVERCGGLGVALEAWENGVSLLDEDRLLHHLIAINSPKLNRRIGAISQMLNAEYRNTELNDLLKETKRRVDFEKTLEIPMFIGIPVNTVNPDWQVSLP